MHRHQPYLHCLTFLLLFLIGISTVTAHAAETLRIGHFPNITHAQALLARETGLVEKKTGAQVQWQAFNAGPAAMEALIAGHLDIAYVGPNPAINAYMRTKGKALRIIAGAASGGAALVVHDRRLSKAKELKGRKIACPELGNTQDVALRTWLRSQGLSPTDVQVLPMKNTEIFTLFQRRQIDAAWVPEPWVNRLLQEADGHIFLDEKLLWPKGRYPTAVVVVRNEFLQQHGELVKRFLAAHVELTRQLIAQPDASQQRVNAQLGKLLGKPLPEKTLKHALQRVEATYDPLTAELLTTAEHAAALGYLPKERAFPRRNLPEIFFLGPLNDVLRQQHLAPVK